MGNQITQAWLMAGKQKKALVMGRGRPRLEVGEGRGKRTKKKNRSFAQRSGGDSEDSLAGGRWAGDDGDGDARGLAGDWRAPGASEVGWRTAGGLGSDSAER